MGITRTHEPTQLGTRGLTVVVSLVVLLGGTLTLSAAAPSPAAAAPLPPCPLASSLPDCTSPAPSATPHPTEPVTSLSCMAGSPQPECRNPDPTAAPGTPCTGPGCLPQPPTASSPPGPVDAGPVGETDVEEAECRLTSLSGCVTNAITAFFRAVVSAALNPLLDLLSTTLLTTPTPQSLPRIGELWTNSWQILLACYALLVLIAGVLVMAFETLQTQYSIKQIAPRVVVGFLAGALSLWAASQAIEIANALAQAVMGGGRDASVAGETLRNLVLGSVNGGIFVLFVGVFLAGMLLVLLVTYIVRVALTIVLIAGAPLALMFHALPQTEPLAYWWWKAFGGCLTIQVVQSLTLITTLRVFLAPGGFTLFGPTTSGLVNLLVALALFYILAKVPFWILGSLRIGSRRRSVVGTIARAYVIGKTLGWINPHHHAPPAGGGPAPHSGPRGGGPRGGGPSPGGPQGAGGPHGGGGSRAGGSAGRNRSSGGGRGPSGGSGRGPSRGSPSGGGRRPHHRGLASPEGRLRPQPLYADRITTPRTPSPPVPMTRVAGPGGRRPPTAHPHSRPASLPRPSVHRAGSPPAAPMRTPRPAVPLRRLPVDRPRRYNTLPASDRSRPVHPVPDLEVVPGERSCAYSR